MKKILLVCDMGMSTSLVVKKMIQVATEKSLALQIEAHGMQDFSTLINEFDCVLLGPQIAYKLEECQSIAEKVNKKVACISMIDYGMLDGEKILAQALSLLEDGSINE